MLVAGLLRQADKESAGSTAVIQGCKLAYSWWDMQEQLVESTVDITDQGVRIAELVKAVASIAALVVAAKAPVAALAVAAVAKVAV